MLNRRLIIGLMVTIALALLAIFSTGILTWLAWVAFVPVFVAWRWNEIEAFQAQLERRDNELLENKATANIQSHHIEDVSEALQVANDALQTQVETLTKIRNVTLSMGSSLDQQDLLDSVIDLSSSLLRFDRTMILVTDFEHQSLKLGTISHPATTTEAQFRLENFAIALADTDEFRLLTHWKAGLSVAENARGLYDKRYGWIFSLLDIEDFFSVPLTINDELLGVIIVDNPFTKAPISEDSKSQLEALGANIAIALQNARLYQLTDEELSKHVQELDMMRQVDRELMEALSWDRVLNMTLDWALRLTGAHSASLAMTNDETQEIRTVASYGFDEAKSEGLRLVHSFDKGITGRVTRTGLPVIVNNVADDPDYISVDPLAKSCLSTPVKRRNHVIAILNLFSPHEGYFTPAHLDFAERLGNRASVAIDNARLFAETQREHEKLSSVLAKTADVIIVVGFDQRLVVLNDAALAVFRLDPHQQHVGKPFDTVFAYTALQDVGSRIFTRADEAINIVEEIPLQENRYFHMAVTSNEQVGWIIVMHDVTPFKETEQLKNELIATVSHDLKNPLSVINGYVELLSMYNELNERGEEFMEMIRRSIRTMRQLIDDLLDLAHIDAGLEIKASELFIHPVVQDSVMSLKNLSDEKNQTVTISVPDDLPAVEGDDKRLRQILVNLVSNAIKYTPPRRQHHRGGRKPKRGSPHLNSGLRIRYQSRRPDADF